MLAKANGRGLKWLVNPFFLLIAGCVSTGIYQAPDAVQTQKFSRELNASSDQVWSAVTYVAGSTFFNIRNFDKGSGLMTLDYSNLRGGLGSYVSCGVMKNGSAPMQTITPEPNSVLNHIADFMSLSGSANITMRSASGKPPKTTVQINSQYVLTVYRAIGNERRVVGVWRFTSREADTQTVMVNFKPTAITCRPSYKIESEFLTEVGARI